MSHDAPVCPSPDLAELLALLETAGIAPGDLPGGGAEDVQTFADALYLLTRMRFEPEDARCYWVEIMRHHRGLAETLGRDVGLRVAVCDYFLNLHPKMRDPVIVEVQVLLQKEQGALLDELTGLYNRRYFNEAMVREVERFKRFGQRFSLVMLDVDHFKRVNDSFGHGFGDEVLQAVGKALSDTSRSFDHVVRYGGEEFAVILPHTESLQGQAAAERLRQAVEDCVVLHEGVAVTVTASLGVATFPEDALNPRDLAARADEALYEAKRTRNVCVSYAQQNRRFARAPLELAVLFARNEGGLVVETAGVSAVNVSFGGMLCLSPTPILPGTTVELVLDRERPGAGDLRIMSRVVRLERSGAAEDYEVALAFDPEDQEECRALVRLMEQEPPRAA